MKSIVNKIVVFLLLLSSAPLLHSQSSGASGGFGENYVLQRPSAIISSVADMVIDEAMKYIGIPYRWGGKSPKGFDCAGFTRFVYSKFGVTLGTSAAPQYRVGTVVRKDELQKGDLVFFGGRGDKHTIGHVGIVTEVNGKSFSFIHSSTSKGITVTPSTDPYYSTRFLGACRVVDQIPSNMPTTSSAVAQTDIPIYRKMLYLSIE